MKLEITADKVKDAAAKCPQAEATLKTLFPGLFKNEISLAFRMFIGDYKLFKDGIGPVTDYMVSIRAGGPYADRAFALGSDFDWRIERDECGVTVLIPTKK